MHFANCVGCIDDPVFIGLITKLEHGARNLGSNKAEDALRLANETEYSLSANTGLTFLPDVEPRTRRISLKFEQRQLRTRLPDPDLHGWILEHRADLLSAIESLVSLWMEAGAPPGPTPFTSFPQWARVVGGIMNFHGLGDPCLTQDDLGVAADAKRRRDAALYEAMFAKHPEEWVEKSVVYLVIHKNEDVGDFDFFGEPLLGMGKERKKQQNEDGTRPAQIRRAEFRRGHSEN